MVIKPGYKQTEIGLIPEGWGVASLGELGEFKNGINKGKEDFGHGFPFINLMDVFGVPRVSVATTELGLLNSTRAERELYELKGGDVLFVRSSVKPDGVGLTALIPEDLVDTVFSGFLIRFRDKGLLEHGFKEHCFWDESFRKRLISSSSVSANTNINQDALKRLKISLPPLSEQRAIATALSDVDALMRALERLIAKKRDLKQAAMQQLLSGKTRLPGFYGEWGAKRLGDMGEIVMGQSPSSSNYNSQGDGLPLIQGNADIANRKTIKRVFTTQITKRGLAGDILLSVRAPVGEVSLAMFDLCLGRGVCAIRYPNDFLYHYLIFLEPMWAKHSKGSTFESVNSTDVRAVEIQLPSDVSEQIAIAAILSDMDTELAALEQRLAKTRTLKQGMTQELLTGRTRLL